MDKRTTIYCILITCATLATITGLAITLGVYAKPKATSAFNTPDESFKIGDSVYLRPIGNMIRAEYYHNYPDQQDKSRIHLITQ